MAKIGRKIKKALPYATIGIVLGLIAAFAAFRPEGGIEQPLQYSHKVHVETAGLTCQDCHTSVQSSSSATIPPLETCSMCHSGEPISESPEEQKLLQYVTEGKEIPWNRVYRVPDHVYFSHRRHVIGGSVECASCHGNVGEFAAPITATFAPVTMEACMDCHRKSDVTNDCLSCHR